MLIIDDILLLPVRGFFYVLREIHRAAEQESVNEAETIRRELSELYMMLETRRITEEQFDANEKELLDRLEAIELRGTVNADASETATQCPGEDSQ